jgi:hypothetical protein
MKNVDHVTKERGRITANVPNISGDYATETIVFGAVGSPGTQEQSFMGVTALFEGSLAGASLELWLPHVTDPTVTKAAQINVDYFFSGKSIVTTGAETWPLAGYPGAMIRVKSGGPGGAIKVSASAF